MEEPKNFFECRIPDYQTSDIRYYHPTLPHIYCDVNGTLHSSSEDMRIIHQARPKSNKNSSMFKSTTIRLYHKEDGRYIYYNISRTKLKLLYECFNSAKESKGVFLNNLNKLDYRKENLRVFTRKEGNVYRSNKIKFIKESVLEGIKRLERTLPDYYNLEGIETLIKYMKLVTYPDDLIEAIQKKLILNFDK